ncbi:hypothetical protein [Streptomyces sp. NPDC053048]|uniref:hypothetical protein n=1 Tax=Streptomyces sp. NPDC053048 TaxID=3365694 RepID=UPI0037CF73A2
MRLFRNAVVAVLGGLLLAASLPTGSSAAEGGGFAWVGPKKKPYFVATLPENKCMSMEQEASGARNYMKKPLEVYPQKNCKGKAVRLAPGQDNGGAAFRSVKYNPK